LEYVVETLKKPFLWEELQIKYYIELRKINVYPRKQKYILGHVMVYGSGIWPQAEKLRVK
jgi:hypothetical protein